MKRTEKSILKRYMLAQAVMFVYEQFGLLGDTSYRRITVSEWPERVTSLLPPPRELLPSQRITDNSDTPAYYFCKSESNPQKYGKFWRNVVNVLKLKQWPAEEYLRLLVHLAFNLHFDELMLRGRRPDEIQRERLLSFLLSYRNYLQKAPDLQEDFESPWKYLEGFTCFTTPVSELVDLPPEVVSRQQICQYVDATIDYLNRFTTQCDNPAMNIVFSGFAQSLRMQKTQTLRDHELSGKTNFTDTQNKIRELAWFTEWQLLQASLVGSSQGLSANFSDSGFSDNAATKAVWCEDRDRRQIVELLRACKERNHAHSFHRVLLLDSLVADDYEMAQLYQLSRDICFLMDNYISVSVSGKRFAKSIDRDLFNYAIIDDGTVMRASEQHTEWRIAKVGTEHEEYQKLFANYQCMKEEASSKLLQFDHERYLERRDWNEGNEERRIREIILPHLLDWMSQLQTPVH